MRYEIGVKPLGCQLIGWDAGGETVVSPLGPGEEPLPAELERAGEGLGLPRLGEARARAAAQQRLRLAEIGRDAAAGRWGRVRHAYLAGSM